MNTRPATTLTGGSSSSTRRSATASMINLPTVHGQSGRKIARGLDEAGVRTIEVAHGIGLGASSIQYGFAAETDANYVRAAVDAVDNADIAVLYVPGIATLPELDAAIDAGIKTVRVAVHCTEADCGQQPIEYAKDKGLRVMSFPHDEMQKQSGLWRGRAPSSPPAGPTSSRQ